MTARRRLAPVWLLGFGFLPLGVNGAVGLVTVPDLLAAAHVPETRIAIVTSLYLAASFLSIPITPLVDWRLKRRTYAIVFALLAAVCTYGALVSIAHLVALATFMFISSLCVALCVSAVGGWFGELLPTERKDALGAWFNVANFCSGGPAAALAIPVMRALPEGLGALGIASFVLLALPIYFFTPCPPADRRLAGESLRLFARDVVDLFRRRDVRWVLAVFLAPSASFALTNTLPGFGGDFHASAELVGVVGGMGVTVAGLAGSLLVSRVARGISPVAVYLLVGLAGAAFTLALLPAPRDPLVFGIGTIGENVFQAAAFAAANAITLRAIGHDNPLAGTQFGVLIGASQIPLTYMQLIDGRAYGIGGVAGSFLADALLSGSACVVLGILYWRFAARPAAAES